MLPLRVLAIAAVARHVAYVCFDHGKIIDWGISDAASRSSERAAAKARQWVESLSPEVVVTEKPKTAKWKGARTRALITAIASEAAEHEVLDVSVVRPRYFANKYDEADDIAQRYPILQPWCCPKRRIQDTEPRNMVLFEAVVLAEVVLNGPPTALAASLG